jgi:hypothetical protein
MSGLTLYLDAANPVSYPGTGTTWSDISGQGNNFTMTGTMAYNSTGYFTSTATAANYWSRSNFAHPTTVATTEMWVQCNVGSSFDGIWSYASVGGDNDNLLYDQNNLTLFGPSGAVLSGLAINDGVWRNLVRVSTRSTGLEQLYINGALIFTTTISAGVNYTTGGTLILGQEQDSVGGNLDPNQALEGNYSVFKIYNRALTDIEVSQNFNALRGRYGI